MTDKNIEEQMIEEAAMSVYIYETQQILLSIAAKGWAGHESGMDDSTFLDFLRPFLIEQIEKLYKINSSMFRRELMEAAKQSIKENPNFSVKEKRKYSNIWNCWNKKEIVILVLKLQQQNLMIHIKR